MCQGYVHVLAFPNYTHFHFHNVGFTLKVFVEYATTILFLANAIALIFSFICECEIGLQYRQPTSTIKRAILLQFEYYQYIFDLLDFYCISTLRVPHFNGTIYPFYSCSCSFHCKHIIHTDYCHKAIRDRSYNSYIVPTCVYYVTILD